MKAQLLLSLLLIAPFCHAQNTFSLGAKIGYGSSALPMEVSLEINGLTKAAKSGATLSTGVIGRYTIGEQIGIESGVWLNHYSFYYEENFRARDALWKSAAEVEIANYQMPIILNYKFKMPRQPLRYFVVGVGTTLDCVIPGIATGLPPSLVPRSFQNIVSSLKAGQERIKGNKLEIGFEIQYSLKQFTCTNQGYSHPTQYRVSSKANIVSLNLAYFFLKKERGHQAT